MFLHVYFEYLLQLSKTDETYAINKRTQNYAFINNGFSEEEALRRSYAEQWFPIGSGGVPLKQRCIIQRRIKRYNAEGQYNNN
jgi:iron complex outermembrane receptor protein